MGNKRVVETFVPRMGHKPIHISLVDETEDRKQKTTAETDTKTKTKGNRAKAFFASFSYFPQMHLTIIEVIHALTITLAHALAL